MPARAKVNADALRLMPEVPVKYKALGRGYTAIMRRRSVRREKGTSFCPPIHLRQIPFFIGRFSDSVKEKNLQFGI
jgi:hypothetical protein